MMIPKNQKRIYLDTFGRSLLHTFLKRRLLADGGVAELTNSAGKRHILHQ